MSSTTYKQGRGKGAPFTVGQLIELVNCLPFPFLRSPDGSGDLIPGPPAARFLHADIIRTESLFRLRHSPFNIELAFNDLEWAAEFEELFEAHAGHFVFVEYGIELFWKYVKKHGVDCLVQMGKSLQPYSVEVPPARGRKKTLFVETHRLIRDRIKRFSLDSMLDDYVTEKVFPAVDNKYLKGTANQVVERRWYELWDAFYKVRDLTNLTPRGIGSDDDHYSIDFDPDIYGGRRSIVYLDESGIVRTNMNLFEQVFGSQEIQGDRIRACKACRLVFWAKRKDQSCCSPKCTNVYHVRIHRQGPLLTLGMIADRVGVQAHVLRYWESEFPMLASRGTHTDGRSLYAVDDVQIALRIKNLLYDQQLTIADAKQKLSEETAQQQSEVQTKVTR